MFCQGLSLSVGAPLKVPRRLERILDGTSVAPSEISDDHHVLDVPGRDAEGLGILPQQRVAVVEIGANHQMRVVKLPRYQPAVVPPLSQASDAAKADTRQGIGQARYVAHLHECGPSCSLCDHDPGISCPYKTGPGLVTSADAPVVAEPAAGAADVDQLRCGGNGSLLFPLLCGDSGRDDRSRP